MKRVERLTAIITFLQSRRYTSMKRLQEKFDVHERTLYRDMASLHEIGVPVSFEPSKGYFILDSHFIPPVSFTRDEAVALTLAGTLMKRFSDKKTIQNFEDAVEKVRYALDESTKEMVESIAENTAGFTYKDFGRKENYLFEIQKALIENKIIKIKYKDRKMQLTEREIEPIGLSFYSQEWHVIGFCWLRNNYRDFIISSILEFKNTGIAYRKQDHLTMNEYIKTLM